MTNCGNTDKSEEIKRLRVCLVSPVPPPLGGLTHWTLLIRRWASNDPRISIAQVDISPRWRAIYDTVVWKRVIGGGLQLLRDCGRFLASVRGADVVHLTTSGQFAVVRDLTISLTAKLLKLPVVYHIHFGRIPAIARSNTLEWRMLSLSMKLSDAIFPIDEATARTLRTHLPHKRIEIVPNPIDPATLPAPSPHRSTKKSLLFLGWVLPSKGIEELLAAWNDLDQDDWELVIAGPGNPAYQRDLMYRFTPHRVRFAGEIPHKAALQLIADCDLFVLPSHTEAFPFVILEAMALGKAIVATDVGAIPEMLAGECGILVKPKDVQGLYNALKTLIEDDALRADIGSRARERVVANYTVDAVFTRLLSLWHWHQVAKRREDDR